MNENEARIVPKDGYTDKFGRKWFLSKPQLCPECGQPDDYSDCNHKRLIDDEVKQLGGTLPENKIGTKEFDLVGYIMDYEGGEISDKRTLELFSHLIKTGQAWTLQGAYGRTARHLIDTDCISEDGEILIEV